MEKNKLFQITLVILILVLGFIFYWFELRPAQIRKECWNKIEKIKSGELKSDKFDSDKFQIGLGNQKVVDAFYSNCLKESGL